MEVIKSPSSSVPEIISKVKSARKGKSLIFIRAWNNISFETRLNAPLTSYFINLIVQLLDTSIESNEDIKDDEISLLQFYKLF